MDLAVLLSYLVVFVVGLCSTIVIQKLIDDAAYKKVKSRAGSIGREKEAAMNDRLMGFIQEAGELYKKMKEENKEPKEMLKEGAILFFKYPDVITRYGKKLLGTLKSSGFDFGSEFEGLF